MNASPMIQCRNLTKDYVLGMEVIHALRGVTLDIAEGEFVAVMGRSGSGKSTLMHLLGALDLATSGELVFAGRDLADLGADELARLRNEKIGFVFQQFNLLARTTALTNVQLPLLYGQVSKREKSRRARECLDMVGLSDRMSHRPSELSGGQQQRVALARALVNNPRIILADEPTGALDIRTGQEIMSLLRDLNEGGITIVVVTHEADVAAFADRQLHFQDGLLIEDRMVTSGDSPIRAEAKPEGVSP